jgi:serine palmitoyltransferase
MGGAPRFDSIFRLILKNIKMNNTLLVAVGDAIAWLQSLYYFIYEKVPGSQIILDYISNSYQNDPFRVVFELFLVIFALKYMFSKKYKPDVNEVRLTEKEMDDLIKEWEPEGLVGELPDELKKQMEELPVIRGPHGAHVVLTDDKSYLNLSSYDVLGFSSMSKIQEAASKSVRKYGVGACGPPGFYGTLDVHMQLEKELANFLGVEDAIIYSQAFSTISGVIPAFSKRGDIIIIDDGVNFAIQKAVQISRSVIKYFKHNDVQDLERVIKEVISEQKSLTRRFILVEGLYQNFGDISPLVDIIALKKKYKFRLIVDESLSFAVLGPKGKGISDHFSVPASEIDMIVSSLSTTLASCGGFCAGTKDVVDHQRLSGLSYCYSAAMPAMMAVASLEGLGELQKNPQVLIKLQMNIKTFLSNFSCSGATLEGSQYSPLHHLKLTKKFENRDEEENILETSKE